MKPAIERFLEKINVVDSGCWEWTAYRNYGGYGLFWYKNKLLSAHRYSYEFYYYKIPKGLEIDHLCKNPSCVNPNHLEAVTRTENMKRSYPSNLRKTHCPQGHEYDKVDLNGYRICTKCRKISKQKYANTPRGKTLRKKYLARPEIIAKRKKYFQNYKIERDNLIMENTN